MSVSDEWKLQALDDAIVVALGSNLKGVYPSVQMLLEAALEAFPHEGFRVVTRSSWWRSKAWPDPTGPAYLNGVAIVETAHAPLEALAALARIEHRFGRDRGERNAARTLDLDLIAWGREILETEALTLPHPRAAERRFVMGPLAEIAPGWRHPVSGEGPLSLAEKASVGMDASRC
ncbi:MAG: 2-amino-4-hydroxy-6-hydroxymethyldihydropteridine diphosphokinase [Proteobacteria bacterium]|nr:2-amino-4-hydroxy-6-hydroxymethyldihydropteridine diphosphokinase [Pseudomonadota bacterium]